jgi:hypothetical protein
VRPRYMIMPSLELAQASRVLDVDEAENYSLRHEDSALTVLGNGRQNNVSVKIISLNLEVVPAKYPERNYTTTKTQI